MPDAESDDFRGLSGTTSSQTPLSVFQSLYAVLQDDHTGLVPACACNAAPEAHQDRSATAPRRPPLADGCRLSEDEVRAALIELWLWAGNAPACNQASAHHGQSGRRHRFVQHAQVERQLLADRAEAARRTRLASVAQERFLHTTARRRCAQCSRTASRATSSYRRARSRSISATMPTGCAANDARAYRRATRCSARAAAIAAVRQRPSIRPAMQCFSAARASTGGCGSGCAILTTPMHRTS